MLVAVAILCLVIGAAGTRLYLNSLEKPTESHQADVSSSTQTTATPEPTSSVVAAGTQAVSGTNATSLRIIYPAGGEFLWRGSQTAIEWSENSITQVYLELIKSGATDWTYGIGYFTPKKLGTQSLAWRVGDAAMVGGSRLRVDDGPFYLRICPTNAAAQVISELCVMSKTPFKIGSTGRGYPTLELSSGSSGALVLPANQMNVPLMQIRVANTSAETVKITGVNELALEYSDPMLQNAVYNLKVYDGGIYLGALSTFGGSENIARSFFINDMTMAPGTSKTLQITGTVQSIPSGSFTLSMHSGGLTGYGLNSMQSTFGSGAASAGPFTIRAQ